jgi:hypothetical protein
MPFLDNSGLPARACNAPASEKSATLGVARFVRDTNGAHTGLCGGDGPG